MTKVLAALWNMLITLITGTNELAEGYSSICRTARVHAEAFEKESTIEAQAKLKELEQKLNATSALEHQA